MHRNTNIQKVRANDKKPLPNGLFYIGRRWFQKTYGNTYHTVEIKDVYNQKQLTYTSMEYGYGESFRQTAHKWLLDNNYDVPENYGDFIQKCNIEYMVIDVDRKKDL
jgi:hypothetical protein